MTTLIRNAIVIPMTEREHCLRADILIKDGRIEEIRYRDGNAYARILFDRDGLRVLAVENL